MINQSFRQIINSIIKSLVSVGVFYAFHYFIFRNKKYAQSKTFLVVVFRNYSVRIVCILLLIPCIYRMPSPILTYRLSKQTPKIEQKKEGQEEADVEIDTASEMKRSKDEKDPSSEESSATSFVSKETDFVFNEKLRSPIQNDQQIAKENNIQEKKKSKVTRIKNKLVSVLDNTDIAMGVIFPVRPNLNIGVTARSDRSFSLAAYYVRPNLNIGVTAHSDRSFSLAANYVRPNLNIGVTARSDRSFSLAANYVQGWNASDTSASPPSSPISERTAEIIQPVSEDRPRTIAWDPLRTQPRGEMLLEDHLMLIRNIFFTFMIYSWIPTRALFHNGVQMINVLLNIFREAFRSSYGNLGVHISPPEGSPQWVVEAFNIPYLQHRFLEIMAAEQEAEEAQQRLADVLREEEELRQVLEYMRLRNRAAEEHLRYMRQELSRAGDIEGSSTEQNQRPLRCEVFSAQEQLNRQSQAIRERRDARRRHSPSRRKPRRPGLERIQEESIRSESSSEEEENPQAAIARQTRLAQFERDQASIRQRMAEIERQKEEDRMAEIERKQQEIQRDIDRSRGLPPTPPRELSNDEMLGQIERDFLDRLEPDSPGDGEIESDSPGDGEIESDSTQFWESEMFLQMMRELHEQDEEERQKVREMEEERHRQTEREIRGVREPANVDQLPESSSGVKNKKKGKGKGKEKKQRRR